MLLQRRAEERVVAVQLFGGEHLRERGDAALVALDGRLDLPDLAGQRLDLEGVDLPVRPAARSACRLGLDLALRFLAGLLLRLGHQLLLVEVVLVVSEIGGRVLVSDLQDLRGQTVEEVAVVADEDECPAVVL